ncbi:MAG: acyl-CoA dehydrogenase [Phototrophicales bacterium]|nr:MAG: acyl-CoA dehydrogenase [Phototrophicales bacterium]
MDFSFSERVHEINARVRQFLDEVVIPLEAYAEEHPDGLSPERLQAARQQAKAAGIFAPQLPTEWGGLGLSLLECVPIFETIGRSLIGPAILNCAAPDEGNLHTLLIAANEEQRERYLKPLAAGEVRSAFAMTEPAPGAGADPNMLQTRAERDGDEWVINGHKWFTTGADGAAFFFIMALTNPEVGARKGATIFLADADTAGIEIVRRIPIMGAEAPGGHCEIIFNNVRLPHSAILGEEGGGFALAQQRLGPARLTHCMRWTGIAQRALEIATAYANEREAFGQPLVGHEAVQWMLADSAIELYQARLMMYHAAWLLDNGHDARKETSMAKVHVAESVNRILDRAIQICGGRGISRDIPLSLWFAEARAFRIYDGPSEVHRMVIARHVAKGR